MERLEAFLEWGGTKKDITFLVLGGVSLLCSIFWGENLPVDPAWIAILLCGVPILLEAIIGLVTAFDIKADVLVSMALRRPRCSLERTLPPARWPSSCSWAAFWRSSPWPRPGRGLKSLVHLTPRTARVMTAEGREDHPRRGRPGGGPAAGPPRGDHPGGRGDSPRPETSINQAVMTGESLPVDKGEGDEVASGTVNQFGAFTMEATKVGEDSSIQRMIRLVQSADAGKAKIVNLADRWATWIVVIALVSAGITWAVTGEIIRAVTILVVFCPCALVLATPTAIMAAIGNATRHGFLVREGDALERLSQVTKVTFDKTGTLTFGTPQVVAVVPLDGATSKETLYAQVACAEALSEHPLGKAVVRCFREEGGGQIPPGEDFQMLPGRGVQVTCQGRQVAAGNPKLLAELGIHLPAQAQTAAERWLQEGCTVIYCGVDGRLAGFLALSDTLRPQAAQTIRRTQAAGVEPVLLTGDNANAAQHIAGQLGIPEVQWSCLPEDKLAYIDASQQKGQPVCMIGDGINDAPALKKAFVGIAMGGVGSDIAVDAADIALVNDDIQELPHLLRLARRMMFTIKCNLTFSMALNFVAIVLAILGILNPVVGALVHNAGSVVVIINAAFLLQWKERSHKEGQ